MQFLLLRGICIPCKDSFSFLHPLQAWLPDGFSPLYSSDSGIQTSGLSAFLSFSGKVACQYGCSYYSFDGFGTAKIVETPKEKIRALRALMKTQTGKDFEFNEKLVSIVNVIRIDCDYYTAKHRPLPGAE